MYTIDDVMNMSAEKQALIFNYIDKFIESRWRQEDEFNSRMGSLKLLMVQEYIKQVDKLTTVKGEDIINKYSVGGSLDENKRKL